MGQVIDEHQVCLDTITSCRCGERSHLDILKDDGDDQRLELSIIIATVNQFVHLEIRLL